MSGATIKGLVKIRMIYSLSTIGTYLKEENNDAVGSGIAYRTHVKKSIWHLCFFEQFLALQSSVLCHLWIFA